MLIDEGERNMVSLKAVGERVTAEKCADILMDNFLEDDVVVLVYVEKDGIWPDCYQLDVRRRKRITAVSKRLKEGQVKKIKKKRVYERKWQKRDQSEEKKKECEMYVKRERKRSFEQEREEGAKRSLRECQNDVEKEKAFAKGKGLLGEGVWEARRCWRGKESAEESEGSVERVCKKVCRRLVAERAWGTKKKKKKKVGKGYWMAVYWYVVSLFSLRV
jgi:hypothetical protein